MKDLVRFFVGRGDAVSYMLVRLFVVSNFQGFIITPLVWLMQLLTADFFLGGSYLNSRLGVERTLFQE